MYRPVNKSREKLILFLTVFIDMMGFSVIFPIFPETLRFFLAQGSDPLLSFFLSIISHYEPSQDNRLFVILFGGFVGSIYSILQFVFAPFWGRMSDRKGRRPILILTSTGNLLGYCIWFFSGSFSLFVFSRFITGAMGGNISVASAAMADVTTEADRAKGMGMIGAGIGLGFIFGPSLSGILSAYDLTAAFPALKSFGVTVFSSSALLSVLIAFINLVLILFFFRETYIDRKEENVRKEFHPIFGLKNATMKELPLLSLIYFLFSLSFSGFEFCINFFMSDHLFFSPRQIGYAFVYLGMIIILVQGGVIRRISGKVKEKSITLFGSVALLVGFILLSLVGTSTIFTMISLAFLAGGSAFVNPGISALTSLFSNKQEQGKNLGILRGFGAISRAISPMLFALIYFSQGPAITFFTSAVLIVLVLIFLTRVKQTA